MLITKIVVLAVVDAIALYAVIVLFLASQWVVLLAVVLVAAAVNWIYFSRAKLPAKYLTPGIIFLAIFQVFVLLYTGYVSRPTTAPVTTVPRSRRSRRSWPPRSSASRTPRPSP